MKYLFGSLIPYRGFFGDWAITLADNALVFSLVAYVVIAIAAYLLGSLNSAIIISKAKFKQDIRQFGSGNAGLTNMHRVYGKEGAIWTLVGDIAKQIVSVLIGALLMGRWGAYLAGAFCMIGHILPAYYHFKGGKGVLTAATMILIIDPAIFLILFIVFAVVLLLTRYVSLASIMAAFTYPAAIGATYKPVHLFEISFAIFVGMLVIFMHRSNIYRIFNNKESKFSFRKKPETQEVLDMEDSENDTQTTDNSTAKNKKKKKK